MHLDNIRQAEIEHFFNNAFKVFYIESASAVYHTTLLEDETMSNRRV